MKAIDPIFRKAGDMSVGTRSATIEVVSRPENRVRYMLCQCLLKDVLSNLLRIEVFLGNLAGEAAMPFVV